MSKFLHYNDDYDNDQDDKADMAKAVAIHQVLPENSQAKLKSGKIMFHREEKVMPTLKMCVNFTDILQKLSEKFDIWSRFLSFK